jgi:hypothetical protein
MRKPIAAAVIAASAATSACGHSRSEDAGPAVSRIYQVGNFDRVEVAGPYDVVIRTGSNPTVSARGGEKLIEQMVVEVKDGELRIHPQERKGWFSGGWNFRGKVELQVTVPELHGATIAGSGDIRVDRVRGERFDGTVAGSGGMNIGAVEVQALKLSIAGSGAAKAASGRAQSVSFEIAGSGDIDARGVRAETADVSIAGSGSIDAQATGTASVSIMGSGDVAVTGGAKCSVSKAGAGNVRCS